MEEAVSACFPPKTTLFGLLNQMSYGFPTWRMKIRYIS